MAEKLWKGVPQSPFVPKPYQKQVLKTQEEKKKTQDNILHSETNIQHLMNFTSTGNRRTMKSPCFSRSENKILRFLDCYWDHEVNYQPPAEIKVRNICAVSLKFCPCI